MLESTDGMRINLERRVDESYDIIFGKDLFPRIAEDLKESPIASRYVIITDSNVGPLYAESLMSCLRDEGIVVDTISFEAGEKSKTAHTCLAITDRMSELKCGRDSAILALGGGVVGDMAGLIAAIFNRGIPYVQIPTTVLAQADSSIGGKTAVDTKHGKNLVGVFKQPAKVYLDVATLSTLPEKDYQSGLGETIKHGVIQDASFFRYLKERVSEILERSPESALRIARSNCRIKGNVVEKDPHEKGLRRILNYGHTIGHAVEQISLRRFEQGDCTDYLRHGEVVAIGMMVAGRIAQIMGSMTEDQIAQQQELISAFGLPVKVPAEMTNESIIAATTSDKKAVGGRSRYVLPVTIGRMNDFGGKYATEVQSSIVEEALEKTRG